MCQRLVKFILKFAGSITIFFKLMSRLITIDLPARRIMSGGYRERRLKFQSKADGSKYLQRNETDIRFA